MITTVSVPTLKSMMTESVVRFIYIKADGSEREAYGTLCDSVISENGAEPDSARPRSPKPGLVTYFDIVKGAWRSFAGSRLVGMDDDYGL